MGANSRRRGRRAKRRSLWSGICGSGGRRATRCSLWSGICGSAGRRVTHCSFWRGTRGSSRWRWRERRRRAAVAAAAASAGEAPPAAARPLTTSAAPQGHCCSTPSDLLPLSAAEHTPYYTSKRCAEGYRYCALGNFDLSPTRAGTVARYSTALPAQSHKRLSSKQGVNARRCPGGYLQSRARWIHIHGCNPDCALQAQASWLVQLARDCCTPNRCYEGYVRLQSHGCKPDCALQRSAHASWLGQLARNFHMIRLAQHPTAVKPPSKGECQLVPRRLPSKYEPGCFSCPDSWLQR